MKRVLSVLAALLILLNANAQKLDGQWKGFFDSNGNSSLYNQDNTEYVLELEIKGTRISGVSYSYFQNRRLFVVCSLSGIFDKKNKSMVITETARLKGNTPFEEDCLQIHTLSFVKAGTEEKLVGSWKPVPHQRNGGGCGVGTTELVRRTLKNELASYNKPQKSSPYSAPKPKAKAPEVVIKNKKVSPPLAGNTIKPKKAVPKTEPQTKVPVQKEETKVIADAEIKKQPAKTLTEDDSFEKRNTEVIKTIQISSETFKVDLYDNGTIDGDSVSLFYNGKLILSHRRLSTKPISISLDATTGRETNDLTMYADNLGEIPPNTALMVVTDGENRYEVRIASDLKKSGTIRFIHKEKTIGN